MLKFSPSPHHPITPSLQNRIALITGASRGIGAAVAKRFALEGAQVILVARDVGGLEATDDAIRSAGIIPPPVGGRLGGGHASAIPGMPPPRPSPYGGGGSATLVPCDLADASKVEMLAAQVAQRFGRIDILVGNAALLGELSPLPHISPEDWNSVMAVNVTANWQLIRCFDALLKRSDAPRAMFVTSGITGGVFPYWGAYAASKAALEAMVGIYAAENAKTPLRVNLIDPGVVRTRMRAKAFPGENANRLPEPEAITDVFVKLAGSAMKKTGKKFYAR